MYAILIGICIKTCGGIWGHNKSAALVKPRRRVAGGYAGEEDRSRARVPTLTASLLDTATKRAFLHEGTRPLN